MKLSVNGEILTKAAVELEYQRILKAYGKDLTPDELARRDVEWQRMALDHAIGRLLLLAEARRRQLRPDHLKIEQLICQLALDCGGDAAWQDYLAKKNMDEDELRRHIYNAHQTELLIAEITAQCPHPTDAEIDAHLQEHLHKYVASSENAQSKTKTEVRAQARAFLLAAEKNKLLSAYVAELRKQASIEEIPG